MTGSEHSALVREIDRVVQDLAGLVESRGGRPVAVTVSVPLEFQPADVEQGILARLADAARGTGVGPEGVEVRTVAAPGPIRMLSVDFER